MTTIVSSESSMTLKFENENIKLLQGDCLNALTQVPDKSIQLVCIDPPYNIGKDTWDNIDNYVEWLLSCLLYTSPSPRD